MPAADGVDDLRVVQIDAKIGTHQGHEAVQDAHPQAVEGMSAGVGKDQQARGVLQGPIHQLRTLGMAADHLVQNGHVRRPQLIGKGQEIPYPVVHPLAQAPLAGPGARLLDHRR